MVTCVGLLWMFLAPVLMRDVHVPLNMRCSPDVGPDRWSIDVGDESLLGFA